MKLVIIAGVAENNVIGKDGGIPWHYSEDMKHFKDTTMGHPVIMGRGTWESFEHGPLPGRKNIVISHEELDLPEEVVNVHGIEEAVEEAGKDDDRAHVIGGESIYRQFLERGLVDEMNITEIPESPEGDTFFPDWDEEDWEEVEREEEGELTFVRYRKV